MLRGESSVAAGEASPIETFVGNSLALLHAHINRAIAAAIFGDEVGLTRHAAAAIPLLPAQSLYLTATARLVRGLDLAGQARASDGDDQAGLLAELDDVTRWLAACAGRAGQFPAPAAADRGRAGLGG